MKDKKDRKFNTGLAIFIGLIVLALGITAFTIFNPLNMNFSKTDIKNNISLNGTTVQKGKTREYIATLYIEGTIENENNSYNQKWILETISKLKNDKNNVAIALFINSPGGGVYQSDEVYLALQDYRTSGKKVYAYMGSLAASGGYYISCAAEKIYANRNTLTGSIGVISGQTFDLTGLFDKMGIKSETIHAGKNKNMGNYNEPFTDEQRAIMQSIADECYDQFVAIVAHSRNMTIVDVEKLADGRVYTAKQALENGLIDKIDSFEYMMYTLKTETSGEDTSVKEFRYQRKKSSFEMLLGASTKLRESEAAAKLGLPERVINDMNKCSVYPAYIYEMAE